MSRDTAPAHGEYLVRKMRADWDERAAKDAKHFVLTREQAPESQDFFLTGEISVSDEILNDLGNICQGMSPQDMSIVEIGCGVGRMTRALAQRFGQVHAVDVSPKMLSLARENLHTLQNVHLYPTNGADLRELPSAAFDFAFSFIVYQHIPSLRIIESLTAEVARVLKPGKLFKFQAQGVFALEREESDTWLGQGLSPRQAIELADQTGFEMRYSAGENTQYYWLWFFKR